MKKTQKPATIAGRHVVGNRGQLRSYIIGFGLSIILTMIAFLLVSQQINSSGEAMSRGFVITAIMVLAFAQLLVQLKYFIHLGKESGPQWNKLAFIFMLVIVFIVVAGSLWIMNNLHYNMSSDETESYLMEEEGIKR